MSMITTANNPPSTALTRVERAKKTLREEGNYLSMIALLIGVGMVLSAGMMLNGRTVVDLGTKDAPRDVFAVFSRDQWGVAAVLGGLLWVPAALAFFCFKLQQSLAESRWKSTKPSATIDPDNERRGELNEEIPKHAYRARVAFAIMAFALPMFATFFAIATENSHGSAYWMVNEANAAAAVTIGTFLMAGGLLGLAAKRGMLDRWIGEEDDVQMNSTPL